MTVKYSGPELKPFITGMADYEIGPLHGIIAHKVPKRWRTQIPDSSFCWNEMCSSGIHVDMIIRGPVRLEVAVYEQFGWDHEFAIQRSDGAEVVCHTVPVVDAGIYKDVDDAGGCALTKATATVIDISPIRESTLTHVSVVLPHRAISEIIAVTADEAVLPEAVSSQDINWTHYGSSISQGVSVHNPAKRWTEVVSHQLGLCLYDLSIAGNAQLDAPVARSIATKEADFITCSIGINLVNADSMRERSFVPALHGFLDVIRDRQPTTPIMLISACACPIHETVPGPTYLNEQGKCVAARRDVECDDGALTLQRTRELMSRVVHARQDPHLSLLDGRSLLGDADTQYLEDNLHPNEAGTKLIADRAALVFRKFLKL
ncbi:MAG: GDSL-type esterase/lipase family protein [Bifidobacterium aquikefiri]|uniref:GDSL-like Lipase/Acylhydrolase family protein n=1 Tax=Bifidobacterium aquikefiri TaxID=1653207 RepID=A0A261G8Z2_9BIFI|nr:GDSL-type esterase/lipase family protein [Bifidobacterium aquikefiri]OZG67899.1 GDSL-like Lipase/Acylhydrolase family protein [Bifidobacterium aquikefiri]